MHAVLRIDLEAFVAVVFSHDLIHASRAITLRRLIVHRQVLLQRDAGVFQRQVNRLIFFVVGVGDKHGRQLVKAEHTIGLGIVDLGRFGRFLHARVIRLVVVQRQRNLAAEPILIDVVERATEQRSEFVNGGAEVTCCKQLVIQPAGLEAIDVTGQFVTTFASSFERLNDGVSGEHARFHGGVAALDLGEVQCTQIAADQCPTGEDHLRQ